MDPEPLILKTKGKGWLRLAAAADLVGVSEHTLRRWADAGEVASYRTAGGQRRFRRADLQRLITASASSDAARRRDATPKGPPSQPFAGQEAWLASLLDSSRAAATAPSLEVALGIVAERTAVALGSPECIIYEYDDVLDALIPRALYESEPSGWDGLGKPLPLSEHPVERRLLAEREPLEERLSDPSLDPVSRAVLEAWGDSMCLNVPLCFRDQVTGVLVVFEKGCERHFDAAELAFAAGLGEMAAAAIYNAQLVRRLEVRNRRLASLVDAGRAITSTVVVEDVLAEVAQQAALALNAEQCVIWEYVPERDGLLERAYVTSQPDDDYKPGEFAPLVCDPVSRAILSGGAAVQETISDPHLDAYSRETMEFFGEKTCLSVPLVFNSEPVGILILIESVAERDFSADERDLAMAIGEQASSAIYNAKQFQLQEEQTKRLTALLEASRAITSSVAEDDLLAILARKAAEALGSPECVIWEHDPGGNEIVAKALYQETPRGRGHLGASLRLDDRPAHRAVLAGEEILIETQSDERLDSAVRALMVLAGEQTRLSLPLRFGDEPLGILVLVETEQEREFTAAELELARGLSEHAAVAMHNASLIGRLEMRGHEATLLNDIAKRTATSLNLRDVAAATLDELRRLTRFDRASLLIQGPTGALDVVHSTDGQKRLVDTSVDDLAPGFVARLSRERVVLLDLPADRPLPAGHLAFEGLRSAAVIALFEEGRPVGALTLGSETAGAFGEADRRIFEGVGTHLSLAVKNARLYENIKQLHVGALRALSSALNAKDYYTVGHTARVATYAALLAAELGWAPDLVDRVEEVAYLHDIGKISVSDRILLKPGRLSDEDWQLMREHPVVSAEILQPLLEASLVAGVRHHHEYFDGSGYPDGLAGYDIPPLARLLCVVDSYDAMSSRRLYRPPFTYQESVAELRRCSGTQFDPAMVDAFETVLERLRVVKQRATVTARAAARRIDAAEHMLLRQSSDQRRPEFERVADALRETHAEHLDVPKLSTEVRLDEHRMMVIVDGDPDLELRVPFGESLLTDEEQGQMFAGRQLDSNVVYVNPYGAWICGRAPIVNAEGRVVALVSADVPATVVARGAPSDVARSFSHLVQSAASRLTRLEIDAMTDFLSGLYNHRYFQDRLTEEVANTLATNSELSLLFCDIDRFKEYNDRHGHTAGDTTLRAVAHVIDRCIRTADVAARYGGDEFAVVLVDTSIDVAAAVAERIRTSVHGLHLDTGESRVTVSVGVATLPQDAPTKEGLVECADWAMYLAKSQGRDRVVTYRAGSCVAAAMQEGRPDPKALGAGDGEPGPPATPGADATAAGLAAPRSPGLSTRSVAVDRLAAELAADLGLETEAVLATVRRVLGDE